MAITTLENGFVFVPRADWGARHSAGRTVMPKVDTVVLHHTATSASDDPCSNMRKVEDALNGRGLAPGYSYVINPSGVVLEGAGGLKGAHTEGMNGRAFGISFIGNYDVQSPTLAALVAAGRTVNMLRFFGRLEADLASVKILLHRETKATACPGAHMVNIPGPDGQNRTVAQWVRLFAATNA